MKQYIVTLTADEVEALLICLCQTQLDLDKAADALEENNRTGINSRAIRLKRERASYCDELWHKLYAQTEGGN